MTIWRRACLIAVTIVIIGCTSDSEPPQVSAIATDQARVEILTRQSDSETQALSTFLLHYDPADNCLFHLEEDNNGEPGTGGRVVIAWPEGYTALSRGDNVTVFDPDGRAVARTGVPFQLAGGGGPATEDHCGAVGEWVASGVPSPVLDG